MRVAFQCDPFDTLAPETDTTLALMAEGLHRGFQIYCYTPKDLLWREGELIAHGYPLHLSAKNNLTVERGNSPEPLHLITMDTVWIRQDPPFDMEYLTPTYLLETLPSTTLILNDPAGIRSAPEKLLITHFPDLLPPTLITSRKKQAEAFLQQHSSLVLKPLYDYGGRSIFHLTTQGALTEKWAYLERLYPREPFLCQAFLPDVYKGDKRLFLIDGQYAGGYKKMPSKGEFRSNLAVGGQATPHQPTPRDLEICHTIGPLLKNMGLFFTGIDVIGNFLTEINVTCPTGLKAFEALYGKKLEKDIWNKVEEKIVENFSSLKD